jgi:hypothetical protein
MSLTPQEQAMLDYLQSVYPRGLRANANDENSLIYKYDEVRVNALNTQVLQRNTWVNNLFVTSSNEQGVEERENFLKIPVDGSLSLAARKARLLVRLAWNPATIQNLRTVIEAFIWNGTYWITELWKLTPFDVDDTWTYMVDLYSPQPNRFITEMITVLNAVHPAHCQLIMAYTHPVLDNIGIQDNLDWAIHTPFIRAPSGQESLRGSDLTPLVWEYRS